MSQDQVSYSVHERQCIKLSNCVPELVRQAWNYRFLILQLLKRDLLFANRKGVLKYLWIFISPAVGSIAWIMMNYVGVLKPGSTGVPYPVFVMIGTNIWAFWLSTVTMASSTLTGSGGLVTKIKYPHEIFFVKQVLHQLILFLIGFTFNIVVMFFYKVPFFWESFLFPLALLPLLLMSSAMGLFASLLNVVFSDFINVFTTIFGLFIYVTPILYSNIENERLRIFVHWNPLTHLIASPRDLLLFGRLYEVDGFIYSSVLSLVLFLFSLYYFYRCKSRLIEKLI